MVEDLYKCLLDGTISQHLLVNIIYLLVNIY
jgi:hypothetical protein